jgi:hypothetical protein
VHPETFEREYAYYLSRPLGEETARCGGHSNAAIPGNPTPGTPFHGTFELSTTLPKVSVRDALHLRRKDGGSAAHGGRSSSSQLTGMQCARPTHL